MALKTLAKYMDTIVTRRETASTAQDRGAWWHKHPCQAHQRPPAAHKSTAAVHHHWSPSPRHQTGAADCAASTYNGFRASCHFHRTVRSGTTEKPCKFLITGISRPNSEGFYVIPSVLSITAKRKITALAMCPDPSCFIPCELMIAQALSFTWTTL